MADWNSKIIDEFRSNQGRVGGYFKGMDLLLLHVTGAKSGKTYIKPLAFHMDGDNYVVAASKGGEPTNPAWYYNLVAHPEVEVEVGTDTFRAKATEATGAERDRLYAAHAAKMPNFNEYEQKTDRVIPVFVLTRI
jgi:deazaflavin-dependent oxidoreductase (nitroreductase family)